MVLSGKNRDLSDKQKEHETYEQEESQYSNINIREKKEMKAKFNKVENKQTKTKGKD